VIYQRDSSPSFKYRDKERQAHMNHIFSAISFFGVDIFDFIVRIMGSEVLRTVISFLIRQSLTHIGL
jgi:hypothetical protein